MPWPMVHFGIAAQLLDGKPSPSILLGSIAPDAIHVRGQVSREEKGGTHFVTEGQLPSVEQLKQKYMYYMAGATEGERADFVLGYIAHVYADMRWTETIYAGFESEFALTPLSQNRAIREVYNEEQCQTEFMLLHTQPWAEDVLHKLRLAKPAGLEPLVTEEEVCQYRDVKLGWINETDNEPKIEPHFFTAAAVLAFIDQTAAELKLLFLEWNRTYTVDMRG